MIARTRILITLAFVCHLLLAPGLVTSQAHTSQNEAQAAPASSGKPIAPVKKGELVTITTSESGIQEKVGGVYHLRGDVEIRFRNYVLRADDITYNDATGEVVAEGHVVLDGGPHDEHLTAARATYNVDSDTGRFFTVTGTTGAKTRGRTVVLTTSNPFAFTGRIVDKDGEKYTVHHGTVTSCKLPRPKWTFHASEVTVVPGEDAKIYHTSFWLWRVPVFYLPFADHPVEKMGRHTGFLLPSIGQSSRKGTIVGDSFFWAINRSMDATLGAELYSKRGFAQHGEFRARPTDASFVDARYFGVLDRGLPTTQFIAGPNGSVIALPGKQDQGGEELRIIAASPFGHGMRGVADIDYLSSYLFRASFSESFAQAINTEVSSTAFLTDDWRGYSLNLMSSRYQSFQNQNLQAGGNSVLITIVHAPSLEASTVDREIGWSRLRWGFEAAAEGLSRREPSFVTANVVPRLDVAPRMALPLFWRGWSLRPEIEVRDTWYGDRLVPIGSGIGEPSGAAINRHALETSVEFRPPSLGRIFGRKVFAHEWKHTIEPRLIYRNVSGVDNFHQILRFDARDILSNTNEVEYGIVQRLFAKRSKGKDCPGENCPSAREVVSWELTQKYFFDPTFGGALVNGVRNVFTSTVELTGIAFLTEPRRFSPIVSRLRARGPASDIEWQLDFDTKLARINASSVWVNHKLFSDVYIGGAHYYLQTPGEILSSGGLLPAPAKFNQFRVITSYGHPNKRGLNAAATIGFDANQGFLQYSAGQTSYNWDCCGITFEYRRFALGALRNENQFRFALSLANVGTFGTLRKQERLY